MTPELIELIKRTFRGVHLLAYLKREELVQTGKENDLQRAAEAANAAQSLRRRGVFFDSAIGITSAYGQLLNIGFRYPIQRMLEFLGSCKKFCVRAVLHSLNRQHKSVTELDRELRLGSMPFPGRIFPLRRDIPQRQVH